MANFFFIESLILSEVRNKIVCKMQRVCLDRQRHNPLIDRKIRGSILLMSKLNEYQKPQILISFSIQTLSHTLINKLEIKFGM
jgi:hypothetical protein